MSVHSAYEMTALSSQNSWDNLVNRNCIIVEVKIKNIWIPDEMEFLLILVLTDNLMDIIFTLILSKITVYIFSESKHSQILHHL